MNETMTKCANDAGPICGCDEKYEFIKNYKPFIPGGIHPYWTRQMPDEPLAVYWKIPKISMTCLAPLEAVAVPPSELPENIRKNLLGDEFLFIKRQKYTDEYIKAKVKQCEREHFRECNCPKN